MTSKEREYKILKATEAVEAIQFHKASLEKKFLNTEGMTYTEVYWLKKEHARVIKELRKAIKTLKRLKGEPWKDSQIKLV
jgi:hypothetical protein